MFTDSAIFEVYLLDLTQWVRLRRLLFEETRLMFRIIDPAKDAAYAVAYNRVYRLQKLRAGKCVSCNAVVDPRSRRRCAYHIKKEREYKKRSWRKKQHQRTLLDQSNAKRVVTSAVSFAQK